MRNGTRSSCLRQIHMLIDKLSYKNDILSCRQKQQEHPRSTKYSVFSWRGVRENNSAHLRACCWQKGRADVSIPSLLQKLSITPPAGQSASGLHVCPLLRGLSHCWTEGLWSLLASPVCKLCVCSTPPRKTPWHQLGILARQPTSRDGHTARCQSSVCQATGLLGGHCWPVFAWDGS